MHDNGADPCWQSRWPCCEPRPKRSLVADDPGQDVAHRPLELLVDVGDSGEAKKKAGERRCFDEFVRGPEA